LQHVLSALCCNERDPFVGLPRLAAAYASLRGFVSMSSAVGSPQQLSWLVPGVQQQVISDLRPASAALSTTSAKPEACSLHIMMMSHRLLLQVAAMLANDPSLRVAPLPGSPAHSGMPPSATRFAFEFRYCLERVRWTASPFYTLLMPLHMVWCVRAVGGTCARSFLLLFAGLCSITAHLEHTRQPCFTAGSAHALQLCCVAAECRSSCSGWAGHWCPTSSSASPPSRRWWRDPAVGDIHSSSQRRCQPRGSRSSWRGSCRCSCRGERRCRRHRVSRLAAPSPCTFLGQRQSVLTLQYIATTIESLPAATLRTMQSGWR
jgi:hypothetical protein